MADQESSEELQARRKREEAIKKELLGECNSPAVDRILLPMIEDGSVELTDDLFFALLKETPSWLSTRPFLKRIAQWQYVMNNAMFDDDEQQKAKKNIMGTSKALTPHGERGAPKKVPDIRLFSRYVKLRNLIEELRGKGGLLNKHPEFRQYIPYIPRDRQHKTPNELAIHILANMEGVSERTIRAVIKNATTKPHSSTAKKN